MNLMDLIVPAKAAQVHVVPTSWGKEIALTSQKLIRGDRHFIIATFLNGSKHRSVKTFASGDVPVVIEQLAQHVSQHDFPWRDVRGERQWVRLDQSTITL